MVEGHLFLATAAFENTMKTLDQSAAIESCWIDMMLYMSQHDLRCTQKKVSGPIRERRESLRPCNGELYECVFERDGVAQVRRLEAWESASPQRRQQCVSDDSESDGTPPRRVNSRRGFVF